MEENEKILSQKDLDWENRRLCVDEACIGVIGPDGRCKECGKPEDLKNRKTPDTAPVVADDEASLPSDPEPQDREAATGPEAYWEDRRLCVDEACIGVIGPDGRCKECGKSEDGS